VAIFKGLGASWGWGSIIIISHCVSLHFSIILEIKKKVLFPLLEERARERGDF
jgi:hypothetical protein